MNFSLKITDFFLKKMGLMKGISMQNWFMDKIPSWTHCGYKKNIILVVQQEYLAFLGKKANDRRFKRKYYIYLYIYT